MATVNYKGNDVDFADVFYPFISEKEGYRNVVYLDHKGYPTVGIGHLVTQGDNLKVGDAISSERVQSLFLADYQELQIEHYAQEILNAGYSYNMALAISSFTWGHGLGDPHDVGYKDSQLRKGLLAHSFDANSVQTYLAKNWDRESPKNQERNRKDFEMGFSRQPWEPGFFLSRNKR